MKVLYFLLFFVFLILTLKHEVPVEGVVMETLGIIGFVIGVASFIMDIIDETKVSNEQLLEEFHGLNQKLNNIQYQIQKFGQEFGSWTQTVPDVIDRVLKFNKLEGYIRHINIMHKKFTWYQDNPSEINNHTLLNFAEEVTSHNALSILNLKDLVHGMVDPGTYIRFKRSLREKKLRRRNNLRSRKYKNESKSFGIKSILSKASIFQLLERHLMSLDGCNSHMTSQQKILGLYSLIILAHIRSFLMINFAYSFLTLNGKGSFKIEQKKMNEEYETIVLVTSNLAKNSISRVSSEVSLCYPQEHRENETYVMFTELLQAIVELESNLYEDGKCINKYIKNVSYAQAYYNSGKSRSFNGKSCLGNLHDCSFIEPKYYWFSPTAFGKVCLSSRPHRRYDWIEETESEEVHGGNNGEKTPCQRVRDIKADYSPWIPCGPYMCICDARNSPTSDRHVSLIPAVADLEEGKVVTGVRIRKHSGVVMFQIQQGKAMPFGQIDSTSLEWNELPYIDVNNSSFVEGIDYRTLSYFNRHLQLNHLKAPAGHVITGLGMCSTSNGFYLRLKVRVTPINLDTGVLNSNSSYWIENYDRYMFNVRLQNPDIPTKVNLSSVQISSENKCVKFQQTDLKADASQMTVPYFDARPVFTSPASWISGVNLHHKGGPGSGGFVSLSLETFNLTSLFQSPLKSVDESLVDANYTTNLLE